MRWMEFPGCCGIAVIYGLHPSFNDDRTHKECLRSVELEVDDAKYPLALATTVPSQAKAIEALKERGWQEMYTFLSNRTGNEITIWRKFIYE